MGGSLGVGGMLGNVFALIVALSVGPLTVRAGIPVIDASNLSQTVMTAIESVAQTLKQIEQYQTQLQQFENQLQNTVAPAAYIDRLLRGIVGIEIPIARLEGRLKASQDEALADRQGTVAGLQAQPHTEAQALARWVHEAIERDR